MKPVSHLLAVIVLLMPVAVNAAGKFEIQGNNVLTLETYGQSGNKASTPFVHDGFQAFNRMQFDFTYKPDDYSSFEGQVNMVSNASEYRSEGTGTYPRTLSLTYENGKSAVPYRIRLGNQYAHYSQRTLRESYKGIQVELQPLSDSSMRQSFLLTAGVTDTRWRDTEDDPDKLVGFSWLMENPVFGQIGINYAYHKQEAGVDQSDRSQEVASIMFHSPLDFGSQSVDIEGEWVYFTGDHADIDGPGTGRSNSDTGYFLRAKGRGASPFTWQVKFEEYGLHYQPLGTSVATNRRSQELHAGWRFNSGLSLRGRAQNFETGFDEENPETVTVYGISLEGALLGSFDERLSGSLDAYLQESDNKNGTLDNEFTSVRLQVNRPLFNDWIGQFRLFYTDTNEKVRGGVNSENFQYQLNLNRSVSFFGMRGSIAPGVLYRKTESNTTSREWRPQLSASFQDGVHSMGFNIGLLDQERSGVGTNDVKTLSTSLRYGYVHKRHRFRVETSYIDREPDGERSTGSYRVVATWSYSFDKVVRQSYGASSPVPVDYDSLQLDSSLLVTLPRNRTVSEVQTLLSAGGLITGNPIKSSFGLVYHTRLLDDIENNQRFVVSSSNGVVIGTALIVDFGLGMSGREAGQLYEDIEDQLIQLFGSPFKRAATGEFTRSWVSDVNSEALVRDVTWRVAGDIVRFGIPKRLDGFVRLEIQVSSFPPDDNDPYWSLEFII